MSQDIRRDALIVGINTYEYSPLQGLKASAQDAEAIARMLTKYGNFRVRRLPAVKDKENLENDLGRVGQTTKVSVSFKLLEEALKQLFLPEGDYVPETALLFFSGHGLRKPIGRRYEGYLATSDVNPDKHHWGLSLQNLRQILQDSPVRQQIVWLDCCYSGELFNFDEADPGNQEESDRCFITASRAFEIALEKASGTHGVLTAALLKGLNPEERPDDSVTTYTLADFINKELKIQTQRPLCHNSGSPIILTTCKQPKSVNSPDEGICPYKGLEYFKQEDAHIFWGRTALTDELIEQVRTENFIAVLGASGSGKSSVLRAGLLRQLNLGVKLTGSNRWQIYQPFTPGEHPLQNLEAVIGRAANELNQLVTEAETSRVVLVVDQFEECFTMCQDSREREQFFDCLLSAVEREDNKLCLVLGMRADFLGKCAEYAGLAKIDKHLVTVKPMTPKELEEAIIKPAEQVGLQVEPQLVTRMIDDVADSPGSLPLLQYTLRELWKARREPVMNWLTLFSYEQLGGDKGGIKGILEKRANEVYESLDEEEKPVAQRIFLELTQLGEVADTRRRVRKEDLINSQHSEVLLDGVINKLTEARLITTTEAGLITTTAPSKSQDSQPTQTDVLKPGKLERDAVIDITHEALIRHWEKLRDWVKKYRVPLEIERRIEADAKEWVNKGKPEGLLLREGRLVEAEDYQRDYLSLGFLDGIAQEFIEESIKLRVHLQRQEKIRTRKTIGGLAIGLIVFFCLSLLASTLWARAENQRKLAEENAKTAKSVQLATASTASLEVDTTRSLLLALIAVLIKETPQANQALWSAFQSNHEKYHLEHGGDVTYGEYDLTNSKRVLTVSNTSAKVWNLEDLSRPCELKNPHTKDINHGSFNPKQPELVLTVSDDSTAIVWDTSAENCSPKTKLVGHTAPVRYGSFDPQDPNRVLTASSDQTAAIWDIRNPNKPIQILKGHTGEVERAEFDPGNSNRVLTISNDRTARVWNLKYPEKTLILKGHQGEIRYACFGSKKSNQVLTVSSDKTARVWNLEKPSQPIVLSGHEGTVTTGSFDPKNPNRVLTVSEDGAVRVWDLSKPNQPSQVIRSNLNQIKYAAFHPTDSDQLLLLGTDGSNGKAEVWSIQSNSVKHKLIGHKDTVRFGAFNLKNPNQIITVGADSAGKIWEISPKTVFETSSKEGIIVHAAFNSKENDQVLTINKDGLIQKISSQNKTTSQPIKLDVKIDSIVSAGFNPDDFNSVATVNKEGKIQVWNLNYPNKPNILPIWNDKAKSLQYNPKNTQELLIANSNGSITIRQILTTDSEPIGVLSFPPHNLTFGNFSPKNSEEITTASDDGFLRIWGKAQGSEFQPKPDLTRKMSDKPLWFSNFDTSGNKVITGGSDGKAWIRNLLDKENKNPIVLSGHKNTVVYGSFAINDSNRVVTASEDGSINVWDLRNLASPIIIKNPDEKNIYSVFNPTDSNEILTLNTSGKLKLYVVGGNPLIARAWDGISRCLDSNEVKQNALADKDLLYKRFLVKSQKNKEINYRPYCE